MIVCLWTNVTRERRRLALVGLCVLAVALGATLFPTAGFGSVPGESAGDGSGGGGGGEQVASTSTSTATPSATPSDRRIPTSNQVDTPTQTATPTPTDKHEQPPPDRSGNPPLGPVGWLLANGLKIAGVGLVVGVAILCVRVFGDRFDGRGPAGDEGGPRAGGTLTLLFSPVRLGKRISQVTMVALVGFSTLTARTLRAAGSVTGTVGSVIGALVPRAWPSGRGALATVRSAAVAPFALLSGLSLSAVPGVFGAVTASGTAEPASTQPTDGRVAASVEPTDDADEDDDGPTTVTEAWTVLTDSVHVDDPDSTTPTEYARAAVRQGLPAEPVGRLAKSFRRVRYGDRRPTADQTAVAVAAAGRIQSALADSDEDGDAPDSDDTSDPDDESPGGVD